MGSAAPKAAGRPRAPARWARRALPPLLLAALFAAIEGCAQVEPPSGGPEDKTLPRVLGWKPDSGAVGVRPDTITILFSKRMNESTVRDWTVITPPLAVREVRWKDLKAELVLRAPPDTGKTYAILLGAEVVDQRNNPLGPWSAAFSTGRTLETGVVEGKIHGGRLKVGGAYLYVWPWTDSLPKMEGGEIPPALRIGQADNNGGFRISYLPRNLPMRLCALYDAGHDRNFNAEDDVWGCLDSALVIGDTTRVRSNLDIYLVYPDEPGGLKGTAVDSSCLGRGVDAIRRYRHEADSLSLLVGAAKAAKPVGVSAESLIGFKAPIKVVVDTLAVRRRLSAIDSLVAAARLDSARCALPIIVRVYEKDTSLVAEVRGKGPFEFRDLNPGAYRIRGFRDMNANGLPDSTEPAGAYPTPVVIRPGRTVEGLDFPLRRKP